MTGTPDAHHGELLEDEGIVLSTVATEPTADGEIRRLLASGILILEDGVVRPLGEGRAATWQAAVDLKDVNTPPGSPTTGYRVIVGSSPTGAFVGHAGEIAQWTGAAWVFTVPKQGMVTHVKGDSQPFKQTAAAAPWLWSAFSVGPHAPTHGKNSSDEVLAQNLGSGGTTPAGKLLRSDGAGGWELVDYVPGYPAALEYASDNTLSITTSGTFQVKLSYTTANLALGHYLVFAQAVLSGSANNTETEGQFLVGTTVVQTLAARLSRVGAEFALFSMYVLDEVSGPQTFTIQYRKSGGSGSASIRDARVIMWRLF